MYRSETISVIQLVLKPICSEMASCNILSGVDTLITIHTPSFVMFEFLLSPALNRVKCFVNTNNGPRRRPCDLCRAFRPSS